LQQILYFLSFISAANRLRKSGLQNEEPMLDPAFL